MIILIKLFLNSKLDLVQTVKCVKQLFRIQIKKGGKVLLCNQVKSRWKLAILNWFYKNLTNYCKAMYFIALDICYEPQQPHRVLKFQHKMSAFFMKS